MRHARLLAALLPALFQPLLSTAHAGEAGIWLEKMARAARELNYQGTFVYEREGRTDALRIVHRADADGERERLTALSGSAREVVRDGERITCILPEDHSVMVDGGHPRGPFTGALHDLGEVPEHYRAELGGRERIAGRIARELRLDPVDGYRYGHRLWLDEQSGLLLRSELRDSGGEVLERMMFTDLDLDAEVGGGELAPTLKGHSFTWRREEHSEPAGDTAWEVARLPAGFHLDKDWKHGMPAHEEPVEHLMFSDGLASVSVFIEPDQGQTEPALTRMGALHLMTLHSGGHKLTVVGEVPAETVRAIGESLRIKAERQ